MSKIALTIAILFPLAAFAAAPASAPSIQQPGHTQIGNVVGIHGAKAFDQLAMGPDPGGKTGDTVTPTTTKTGQPSADGGHASNQSSASTASPSGTGGKPDAKKRSEK